MKNTNKKFDKKLLRAWAMYDWANSAYALVISSAIFPIFYETVTRDGDNDKLFLWGLEFKNTELYDYALALSFLTVAFLSPLLSSIADYTGNKKVFMKFFTYLGAFSTMMLFFFTGRENVLWALGFSILASIGFWGSLVFYNAFLPEIAPPEKQDYASALGFTYGYIGSVILMVFNLIMISKPEWFGIDHDPTLPARISFVTVGLWWLLFAQIPFRKLPDNIYDQPKKFKWRDLLKGYTKLLEVLKKVRHQPYLRRFLYAFFLYSFAAQTIFYVAGLFGSKELRLPSDKLILTILVVQLVGIVGAMSFSKLAAKIGNIRALLAVLSIWVLITLLAYFLDKDQKYVEYYFYGLGALVGLVMGSIQTLSRSTYSKMLPEDPSVHTTYFSFYDVFEKIAIVLGSFTFGYMEYLTGSMKSAILLMMSFFLIAAFILAPLQKYWRQRFART